MAGASLEQGAPSVQGPPQQFRARLQPALHFLTRMRSLKRQSMRTAIRAKRLTDLLFTRKHFLVAGVACTTGAANVVCLLSFDAFGTVLTGNTIKLATTLVDGDFVGAAFFALVLLTYCLGASLSFVLLVA